jgi:predicted nucleic acid-binding Zn ribbon protein
MAKDSTGGLQPGRDPDEIDAAQAALNRMREAAAARGEIRQSAAAGSSRGTPTSRKQGGLRDTRGFSQFHGSGRDPLGLSKVVGRLVAERGWTSPVAVGSVMAEWATLVGPDIAAHCTPESFSDTTLHVRCDSTAWATQLRLLSTSLLEKFRQELGEGVVTKIQVLGPAAPSWRKGGRTVNGRGPRDTYG